MTTRASMVLLLALMLTLAVPLALDSFLRGGHVTPEQALRHQAAVAVRGAHQHDEGSPHQHDQATTAARAATATLATDAGPSLLPDMPPLVAGPWFGLLTSVAIILTLLAGRLASHAPRPALLGAAVAVPSPPPRG
jgi:hypothetical protein